MHRHDIAMPSRFHGDTIQGRVDVVVPGLKTRSDQTRLVALSTKAGIHPRRGTKHRRIRRSNQRRIHIRGRIHDIHGIPVRRIHVRRILGSRIHGRAGCCLP